MMNEKGFNLWADGYDLSVKLSEERNEYPFAGYKDVLNHIYYIIKKRKTAKVLDIGFGTGVLTKKLYDEGYTIHGMDFSKAMINIARQIMPKASLIEWDFTNGLAYSFVNEKYDFIISSYAIHHLTDLQKVDFINNLKRNLNPGGAILIGDVSFLNDSELNKCKNENIKYWDNDEIYISYDNIKNKLNYIIKSYKQASVCAGILMLSDSI